MLGDHVTELHGIQGTVVDEWGEHVLPLGHAVESVGERAADRGDGGLGSKVDCVVVPTDAKNAVADFKIAGLLHEQVTASTMGAAAPTLVHQPSLRPALRYRDAGRSTRPPTTFTSLLEAELIELQRRRVLRHRPSCRLIKADGMIRLDLDPYGEPSASQVRQDFVEDLLEVDGFFTVG